MFEYFNSVDRFVDQIRQNKIDLKFAHELVETLKTKDTCVYFILYDLLAKHIANTEPESEPIIFPDWEKDHPTNVNIWK